METQTNWLELESENLQAPTGERLPALKFVEENKIYEFDVDFTKPFNKYTDRSQDKTSVIKAIIPVTDLEGRKIWWLNVKNPSYKTLINCGKTGQTHFRVMRTGTAQNTRYVFIK